MLEVECTEEGVVALRSITGLQLSNHADLVALGRARGFRYLYEVSLHSDSSIAMEGLPPVEELRRKFAACFVAGPKRKRFVTSALPGVEPIGPHSVLLLEADERWAQGKGIGRWMGEFGLVHRIKSSSPPRHTLPVDGVRNMATFSLFVVFIILVSLKIVSLDYGGVITILLLLVMKSLDYRQLMAALGDKASILLIVAGTLPFGTSLQRTGVVELFANAVVQLSVPMGSLGILATIYVTAFILSSLFNNTATVVLLIPIVVSVAEKEPSVGI